MPPKLRKDKSTRGSKITPKCTVNKYDILSEDKQTNNPAKNTSEAPTKLKTPQPTTAAQLATMQNDFNILRHIAINTSILTQVQIFTPQPTRQTS